MERTEQISHYRIVEKIGAGGMGEVYRATDTKLDRDVALKILPHEMSSHPERLYRFSQEAKTVAGLSHPNIVTLHSVDESDGVHFLTMELVDGEGLDDILPLSGFSVEKLLDVAIPIADALANAHASGIVHRDLKPGNVMLTRDGRIKVLDFGLAKLSAVEADDDSDPGDLLTRTQEGLVLGTPHYMAPEQARGEPIDHRADLFSFGVMLYEMATGRRPFDGKSSIELLSSVLRDEPKDISRVRPDIPPRLARLIRRCLAKDRDQRFAAADEVMHELQAVRQEVTTGAVEAIPEPTAQPRSPTRWMLAGAALITVAVAVTWLATRRPESPTSSQSATSRPIIAVLPFDNVGQSDEEYFAAGMTDEINSTLSSLGGLGVISHTSARIYKNSSKTSRQIGSELNADFLLEGTIRWDRSSDPERVLISPRLVRVADDTQLWSERFERDVSGVFELQADIATRIADALGVQLGGNEQNELRAPLTDDIDAYAAYLQGLGLLQAPGFSRESFESGVELFQRAVELDPNFVHGHARLASMHARMAHYGFDRSEQRKQAAKVTAERALELGPDVAIAHLSLGHYYYWVARDYKRALEALKRAEEIDANDSEIWLTTAWVRRRQGDFEAALQLLERDLALNPRDANAVVGLGETYGTLRRYAEGEAAFERAIALAAGDSYPYTELALLHLRWHGDSVAARSTLEVMPESVGSEACRVGYLTELLDRQFDAALEQLDNCPGDVLEAGAFYKPIPLLQGLIYRAMGRDNRAEAAFSEARRMLELRLKSTPDDARLHSALALALAGLGERDDALRHGERAISLYPPSRDALEAPVLQIDLALVYTLIGEERSAIKELDELLSRPSILSTAWLEHDPRWDSLRHNSEFTALLERHRAEASE